MKNLIPFNSLKVVSWLTFSVALTAQMAVAAPSLESPLDQTKAAIALPYNEALKTALDNIQYSDFKKESPGGIYTRAARRNGGADAGGGNLVNGQLFDFYENKGSVEIDLESFKKMPELTAAMQRIFEVSPFLAYGLRELGNKIWYFEPKPITNPACLNTSLVAPDKRTVLACQTDLEVRISASAFAKQKPIEQAMLIMHELLVQVAMKNDKYQDSRERTKLEAAVRAFNREVFAPTSKQAERMREMQKILGIQGNFGHQAFYTSAIPGAARYTHAQELQFQEFLYNGRKADIPNICKQYYKAASEHRDHTKNFEAERTFKEILAKNRAELGSFIVDDSKGSLAERVGTEVYFNFSDMLKIYIFNKVYPFPSGLKAREVFCDTLAFERWNFEKFVW